MRKLLFIGLCLCGLAYAETSVPVMYGGEIDEDACAGWGEISGIDVNGDGFVSVRSGPGTKTK